MFDSVYIDDLLVTRVTKLGGLGSPAPRQDVTLLAGRHGAIDRTLYYQGRVLDLQGFIVGPDEGSAWAAFDALKGMLALGSPHTLRFRRSGMPEDEQVQVIVASTVDDSVVPNYPGLIQWGVSFHAADPRIYTAALRSDGYDPAEVMSGGGTDVPLVFPLAFSTSTDALLEVSNGGNFPSPPVLTIQGPVVNPIIDNVTTGESIELVYSLGENDVVEIDVAARTVKLNGALRPDLLTPQATQWWELVPGTNEIRLRGTAMTTYVEGTTNLVPNGGFETDASQWFAHDGTLAPDASRAKFGAQSGKFTVTTAGDAYFAPVGDVGAMRLGMVAGGTYTASAWVYVPTGGGSWSVHLYDHNAAGYHGALQTIDTFDEWVEVVITRTLNSDADQAFLRFEAVAGAVGNSINVDGVQVEAKDHATAYVDTNGTVQSREEQTATALTVAYRDARI